MLPLQSLGGLLFEVHMHVLSAGNPYGCHGRLPQFVFKFCCFV